LWNLRSLPTQPYELMPEVLSTGSVLTGLLDEDSGSFSVPSKVLSYLCVGRPLLVSVPARNAAARVVRESEAGLVTPPEDAGAFVEAAARLYRDSALRDRCAASGFAYARNTFDIQAIGQRFGEIFDATCAPRPAARPVRVAVEIRT
jgi:colanic acid biosynthesis glycosyl transferase WcaI